MKTIIKIAILAAILCGIYFGVRTFIPGFHFGGGLKLMDTPTVVREIKKISELTTATYVDDIVINDTIVKTRSSSKVDVKGWFSGSGLKKETIVSDKYNLVQVATCKVRVGFRLDRIQDDAISVKDSVLYITLPHAEVLDAIMNPSDIHPVYEEKWGSWSDKELHEAATEAHNKAIERAKAKALDSDLLGKAERTGVAKLTAIFKQFGFADIKVNIQ